MLRDILIASAFIALGFVAGFGIAEWKGEPTRAEVTSELAQKIKEKHPELKVEDSYVSTSGPLIYLSLPPASPGGLDRQVGRVEIGYDGEILPSLYDFKKDHIAYHWNSAMSEEDLHAAIDNIEREYQ